MIKKIQLTVLFVLIITTVSLQLYKWNKQTINKNEIDELHQLFNKISPRIIKGTKLSFTTLSESKSQKVILYDYAILTAAPFVITDDYNKNDTLLAINRFNEASAKMYPNYNIIAKSYGENFIIHLLAKK